VGRRIILGLGFNSPSSCLVCKHVKLFHQHVYIFICVWPIGKCIFICKKVELDLCSTSYNEGEAHNIAFKFYSPRIGQGMSVLKLLTTYQFILLT
jgi:hypothetical protein